MNVNDTVDQLNSFLRGEMSAVETYRQAAEALNGNRDAELLEQWRQSHEHRVNLLRDRIVRLGGTPSDGSGPWGTFAQLVEGGAAAFGWKTAIAALEEGEDHGLADYRSDVSKLDADTQAFIRSKILPEQQKTHDAVSSLKKRVALS